VLLGLRRPCRPCRVVRALGRCGRFLELHAASVEPLTHRFVLDLAATTAER
jgi:hypothetical protein